MRYRFIPTSFDPGDPQLTTLRFSANWEWHSLLKTLRRYESRVILLRAPLFWQILSPLHAACNAVGCAFYQNEQENMPLGEAAIRVGDAQVVITDAKDAFKFSLFLVEKNTYAPMWVIIHEPTGDWDIPVLLRDKRIHVAQEVHLFPGVPILTQCETLAEDKLPFFHKTEAVEALFDPSITYTLDPALVSSGTCACGKETFGRSLKKYAHL